MRLVTRSDFDGLVCGVLLNHIGIIDSFKFAHPKDLQDGLVEVTGQDVLANVPYVEGCGMWFDHHSSENERVGNISYTGVSKAAPSCARVIWDYYGGLEKFPAAFTDMMSAVDKVDSGRLSLEEVRNPEGWILLGLIMDPRTGLGRYKDYRISNYQLMLDLLDYCRDKSVDEILALPDVRERTERYWFQQTQFIEMLARRSTVYDKVVVTDLRPEEEIFTGSRFTIYSLYPDCHSSILVIWGIHKQNVVLTVGHSIFNRSCRSDIGSLMLAYGGGGHLRVGTCQVAAGESEKVLAEIIEVLNQD